MSIKKWQHLKIPFEEIKNATNNFAKCIGKGGYGWVYQGVLSVNGKKTKVAVKRLNDQSGGQGLKEFLTEIQLLCNQEHPNLISLVGYCDEGKEKTIVYEFAERGSLDKYIKRISSSNYTLTWLERLKICVDAARGLDHLHNHVGEHHTIIHRDIKSSNILIDENWVAKISDLGLSKLNATGFGTSLIVTNGCGTQGYLEPEYVTTGVLHQKSDVYSFGVVLFEVLCGRLCIFENDDGFSLSGKSVKDHYSKDNLVKIIDPSLREHMGSQSMTKFSAIAYRCLHDDREQRPSIDVVKKELEETLQYQVSAEAVFGQQPRKDNLVDIPKNKTENNVKKKSSSRPASVPLQTSTVEIKKTSNRVVKHSESQLHTRMVDAEAVFGRLPRKDNLVDIGKNKTENNVRKKSSSRPASVPLQTSTVEIKDNLVDTGKNKTKNNLLKKSYSRPIGVPLKTSTVEIKIESLPSMVAGVYSNDDNMQLEATTQLRKLLSIDSPPIEEVIQSGVVPRFVEFLMREDFTQLQYEATWALSNIACGTSDHTGVVTSHGAVPIFVKLLASPSDDVREQAVWALGTIAGDCPQCRDHVLGHRALIPLLSQLNKHTKISMIRNVTWTLSNLFRGKPQPPCEQTRPALPALHQLVHYEDEEILIDACWALSYLSDGTNDRIQAVIDAGVCQRLVELLLHPSPWVLFPALLTIRNIVCGDELQTQHIIEVGALPYLLTLMTNNREKKIIKEICWTISNITAGNEEHIQAVIEAGLITPLTNFLRYAEFDIIEEAALAISNATYGGTDNQIKYLVSQGCIELLCDLLVCPYTSIVTASLEGLENILYMGEVLKKNTGQFGGINYYADLINDAGGLEKLETLQSHEHNEICEKAVKILETYWYEEEDETVGDFDFHVNSVQARVNFSLNLS